MLLSNKYARIINNSTPKRVKIIVISIFIIILLSIILVYTCYDKQEQVKQELSIKQNNYYNWSLLNTSGLNKLPSSFDFNIVEGELRFYHSIPALLEPIQEVLETEIEEETTLVEEIEQESIEVVTEEAETNDSVYVYYEVYDFFYGSDTYHALDYELQEYTYDLCVEYGVEEYFTLILCQLYYESKYEADAVSKTNDYGMAQINKCNHEWLSEKLGITDFLDAKQSILCNVYMMSSYLKKYSVESSLFCYNTGKANGSNTYSKNVMHIWNNGVRQITE